jgi:uridine phosphorylase
MAAATGTVGAEAKKDTSPRPVLPPGCHNKLLDALDEDHFFHIEDSDLNVKAPLRENFGNVKYVFMGGPPDRAASMAKRLSETFGWSSNAFGSTERFALFKVGPCLAISHGIGMPSMLIALHEVTKVLHYAGCTDVIYMRVGTSGGIGVEPGTLVVANEGVNAELETVFESVVLGKRKRMHTTFDAGIADELLAAGRRLQLPIVSAKTMATNDYYEEQARLDGAVSTGYTEAEKFEFLNRAHEFGVRNMEMESTALAAFCNRTGIRGACICAALLDRLKGDQTPGQATPAQMKTWSGNALDVAIEWLRAKVDTKDVVQPESSVASSK